MSGDGPLPIFTNAAQFSVLSDEKYCETYIFNLKCIGNYQTDSIESMLDKRGLKTLRQIRLQLATMVTAKFPNYQKIFKCANKKDHINQIIALTKVLARNEPNEDLKEVFSVIKEPTVPLESLNWSDPDALKKAFIDMSSRINDLESKVDQMKCETCRDTQPEEEYLDQTQEAEAEEESSAPPEEAEQPLQTEVEPHHMMGVEPHHMRAEPKTTKVYIGNVRRTIDCEYVQYYSFTEKNVKLELDDIKEEAVRPQGKVFSVLVPVEKFTQFIANWPEGIKIEKYVSKPKKPASNPHGGYEGNRGNRQETKDRNFNRPPQKNYRQNPSSQERNHRSGDRTQKFRHPSQSDYNSQYRGQSRRDTPYKRSRDTHNQTEGNYRRH